MCKYQRLAQYIPEVKVTLAPFPPLTNVPLCGDSHKPSSMLKVEEWKGI